LEEGPVVRKSSVSLPLAQGMSPQHDPPQSLRLSAEQEKEMIFQALEKSLWIQKDAARELGITPRALNYRIQKLKIKHPRWRKNK
jgi:two-component system response regulator AtoC